MKRFMLTLLGEFYNMKNVKKLSAKHKMLNFLSKKDGRNTFTVAQGRTLFGVSNVTARINDLRNDGHVIYANAKTVKGVKKISYRLGTPTKALVKSAIANGYKFA